MINTPLLSGLLLSAVPIAAIAFAVSALVTRWAIGLAHRGRLLAEVNERSSHTIPTPRLGGIGLVSGIAVGFAVLALMTATPNSLPRILQPSDGDFLHWGRWLGFVLPVMLAFGLGLWDDRSNPPAMAKLAGQILLAFLAPLMGVRLEEVALPFLATPLVLPYPIAVLVSAGWILLVMNAVNFMDGINGLAGRFATHAAFWLLLCTWNLAGWESMLPLCAALWGGATGFLLWNHPRARTFMGDCGSQPLGVLVALLCIHVTTLPTTHTIALLAPVAVVSVFLFDVLLTLVRRSMAGKNLLHAHREHLYQRHLAATGENHGATLAFVSRYLLLTGGAGAAMGLFFSVPGRGGGQAVMALICAGALAHYLWVVLRVEARAASPSRP